MSTFDNIATGASAGAGIGTAITPGVGTAIGAGVGALAGAAAGIIGYLIEHGATEKANAILKAAQEKYGKVDDASVRAAAHQVLGPTALAQIQTDPRFDQIQDESLAKLGDISHGGYSLEDRAQNTAAQDRTAAAASSANRNMLSRLAQRGMAGSGAEIAASLAGHQDAANRVSKENLDIAGRGEDRALRALMDRSHMAAGREQADYGRQEHAASAQDQIDRFNNTAAYTRASDDYARRLAQSNRQIGFASGEAQRTQAQGQSEGGVARSVGEGVQKAAMDAGRYYDYSQGGAGAPAGTSTPTDNGPRPYGLNPDDEE